MGNCFKSQRKTVQVVKPDGKILEYRALIKVSEVLAEFKGYELSDELVVLRYLNPNVELVAGHLYYLIHVPTPSLKEMLQSGAVLLDELVSKQKLDGLSCGSKTWMPSLNSISELD
ncbi:uncharacterized protein LOC130813305 isoform X2 [Amaranthus tricolor]|uniref:uncharacterized protein LOC130813305 isoform X2 n=1 Tax=Amaranthus tricolor TaxID=29722 RepID=UPI002585D039|nr:uncharacterized protein LOC130813305 isoform X2 [Amaranthus tricolor]